MMILDGDKLCKNRKIEICNNKQILKKKKMLNKKKISPAYLII